MTQPGLSCRCAFAENDAGLIAVIEQTLPADNAREVLLELVVLGDEAEKHLSLEQISAVF